MEGWGALICSSSHVVRSKQIATAWVGRRAESPGGGAEAREPAAAAHAASRTHIYHTHTQNINDKSGYEKYGHGVAAGTEAGAHRTSFTALGTLHNVSKSSELCILHKYMLPSTIKRVDDEPNA